MKDGLCPKCGADEVYRHTAQKSEHGIGYLPLWPGWGLYLELYTCLRCGFFETYLPADRTDDDNAEIMQQWTKVPSPFAVSITTTRLPPLQLDQMDVLSFTSIDERARPTGRFRLWYEDGTPFVPAYIALCHDPQGHGYYRCYCDATWQVIDKRSFSSINQALLFIDREYEGVSALLQPQTP